MVRRVITQTEFFERLDAIERTGFHFEQQPTYLFEEEYMEPWRAGDLTTPPATYWPDIADWYRMIRRQTQAGAVIRRARIFEHPDPSEYQLFERWLGQWNTAAGEDLAELPRPVAQANGLLNPGYDFWLIDGTTLIEMPWGPNGEFLDQHTLVTDPDQVAQARQWWARIWSAAQTHAGAVTA